MLFSRILRLCFFYFLLFTGLCKSAQAQNCDVAQTVITTLQQSPVGAYNIWDHVYGTQDERDEYVAALIHPKTSDVIAAGHSFSPAPHGEDKAAHNETLSIFLQQVDKRGRRVWLEQVDVEGALGIVKLMRWKESMVMVVNAYSAGKGYVWIGFFDFQGQLKRHSVLQDKNFTIQAKDIVVESSAQQALLAVQATPLHGGSPASAMLYWLDENGRSVKDRGFLLGLENDVSSIVPLREGGYILAGSIETANGSVAGWILRVDADGRLFWQRPYSRGQKAHIEDAALMPGDRYVATIGTAYPSQKNSRQAAWVMVVDAQSGDLAWQRFYKDEASLFGRNIITESDGTLSVLIDEQDHDDVLLKDFVRLLSLNPRGVILNSRSYHHGNAASAQGMVLGENRERIFFGSAEVSFTQEAMFDKDAAFVDIDDDKSGTHLEPEVIKSREGWIVAATANDVYQDPCK